MGTKRRSTPGPYLLHLELLRDRIADPERYPFNLPAVRALNVLPFHPQVTFLVGENGSGKSTLIEAIAVAAGLNAIGVTPRDMMAIFGSMKQAGALQAELILR